MNDEQQQQNDQRSPAVAATPATPSPKRRSQAIDDGDKFYTGGRPCPSCGGVLRYVSTTDCVPCAKAEATEYAAKVAERLKAARARRRARAGEVAA